MKNALRLLLVASFVAVCLVPTAQMVFPLVEEKGLEGVMEEKKRPELALSGLFSETFQHGFTAWYEQHYGLRASLTRLDNSIFYYAFHEARPEKLIRVGRGDILYISDHVNFWNDRTQHDLGKLARRIKAAEVALHAHGIELVFMTNPTKSMVWPGALPPAWLDPSLPSPRPSEVLRARFPVELAGAGVRFVDGWKLVEPLAKREPEAVYTRTGRHLSSPAGCMITEEALRLARPSLAGMKLPVLDCSYVMHGDMSITEEEYDLWRLLNIITPRTPAKMPAMRLDLPKNEPESELPAALVVGSSFGWKVTKELERNHAVRDLQLYYYNRRVVAWPSLVDKPLPVGSAEWKELMLKKQLVLYVVPEEYLADDEAAFFVESIKAFGEPTPENAALVR